MLKSIGNTGQLQLDLYNACREDFVLPDDVLNLGTTNAEVRRIRKIDMVDRFLNEHHYLHTSEVYKSIAVITRAYGLYLGGDLAGIIVYNPPGSRATGEYLFGNNYDQAEMRQGALALTRLAVHPDAPFNSTGYLISMSLKSLMVDNWDRLKINKAPYRTVISFADTLFHSGTVYQAQNAWYAGVSTGASLGGFYHPVTRHVIHARQGKRTMLRADCPLGYVPFRASDKLRYVFFVGNKHEKLKTMRRLDNRVQFLCKIGQYSAYKEGRIVGLSESRSYAEVRSLFGKKGTDGAKYRYADYLTRAI